MTRLTDPAVREAGARAMWWANSGRHTISHYGVSASKAWDRLHADIRAAWIHDYAHLAEALQPELERAAVREQLRPAVPIDDTPEDAIVAVFEDREGWS